MPTTAGCDATHVHTAAQTLSNTLRPGLDQDWSIRAGQLTWSVRHVVDHLADCCGFFALQLASRSTTRLRVDVTPHPAASNRESLDVVLACTQLLADTVDAADSQARAWHFFGSADPTGFAALACDELLIHSWDAARGLGLEFDPIDSLCATVLKRLFPWAPSGVAAWPALLWVNGRIPLPGLSQLRADWISDPEPIAG